MVNETTVKTDTHIENRYSYSVLLFFTKIATDHKRWEYSCNTCGESCHDGAASKQHMREYHMDLLESAAQRNRVLKRQYKVRSTKRTPTMLVIMKYKDNIAKTLSGYHDNTDNREQTGED